MQGQSGNEELRIFRPGGARKVDPINAGGVESEELVVGATLFMKREIIQPGGIAIPHYHSTSTIVIMQNGRVKVSHGFQMERVDYAGPGDFVFIPPGWPHQPINESSQVAMEALVIRDAAHEEVIPFFPVGRAAA